MQKTIGVLTSGGDAPGMNAAVRAVTRAAIKKGFRVVGIRRGYNGLLNNDMVELTTRDVADIIQRGGTEIFTARCKEFREWEYVLIYDRYRKELYFLTGLFILTFILVLISLLRMRRRSRVERKNMEMLEETHRRVRVEKRYLHPRFQQH